MSKGSAAGKYLARFLRKALGVCLRNPDDLAGFQRLDGLQNLGNEGAEICLETGHLDQLAAASCRCRDQEK